MTEKSDSNFGWWINHKKGTIELFKKEIYFSDVRPFTIMDSVKHRIKRIKSKF